MIIDDFFKPKLTVAEASAANDYFTRRKSEEERIAGVKAPAKNKKNPANTDYAKKRKQQDVTEAGHDHRRRAAASHNDEECSSCDGTGEGRHEGQSCGACGGSGVARGQYDHDDFDIPDKDDMYEGVAEATDPDRNKAQRMIYKYFGQIYDYGNDDGLYYLDLQGELWNQLMDKYDGEIEDIVAREPTAVLIKAAQELKGIADDMKYELDEAGVAEGRVAQLPTHGADYSKYDTDHLKTMLRPGILHRDEARFKSLIRQELKKREQRSQQGVAEGKPQKKADRYHINKDGKPATLASYPDKDSAVKDRDSKYPDAKVHQVGPRGKVKGEFEEGVAEGLSKRDQKDVAAIKSAIERLESQLKQPTADKESIQQSIAHERKRLALYKQGVAEGLEGKVVFSGTGANGGKYKIIQTGPTDFMIHANGKHIDTYSSLQRAMSVLKNEVPGLTKGRAEGSEQNVTVYSNRQGYYAWTPTSGVLVITSGNDGPIKTQTYWGDVKGDEDPQIQRYISNFMKPVEFSELPSRAQRVISRHLLRKDVAEGEQDPQSELKLINQKLKDAYKHVRNNSSVSIGWYMSQVKELKARREELIKQLKQGVAEGSLNEGQYEMMMRNGQVKKFIAKDDADAKRIAAGHGAKSVIRMKGNVPSDKIGEQGVAEGLNENAEDLHIGDPVIITGNGIEFEGATGEIIDFGQQHRFVVVDLYNHGRHSFHSSDVSFNEYAGSNDEEARMYDAGEFGDDDRDDMNESLMKKLHQALLKEGHVKELADDLKTLNDTEFMKKYGKAKAAIRKDMKKLHEAVSTLSPEQLAYNQLRAQLDSANFLRGGNTANTVVNTTPEVQASQANMNNKLAQMAAGLKAKGIDAAAEYDAPEPGAAPAQPVDLNQKYNSKNKVQQPVAAAPVPPAQPGVAEARTSAAQRLSTAWDRQRAKSNASLARTPGSIPKKQEPKKADPVPKTVSEHRAKRQALMAQMLNGH